jgi:hypothetical protein
MAEYDIEVHKYFKLELMECKTDNLNEMLMQFQAWRHRINGCKPEKIWLKFTQVTNFKQANQKATMHIIVVGSLMRPI